MMGSMFRKAMFAGSIVQDNLLFNIDPAAYSGSGTTVPDLSGNGRNGTLVNGPVYNSANGGYFTYDSADDYMAVALSGTFSEFTMSFWAFRNESWNAFAGIIYHRESANTHGLSVSPTANRLGYTWNNATNTWNWNPGATMDIPLNQWCMMTMRVSASSGAVFLNTTKATNAVSHSSGTFGNSSTTMRLGVDTNTLQYLGMRAGPWFAYDRALTDSEITQNYNALVGRYT
jgi:hypothetical protein